MSTVTTGAASMPPGAATPSPRWVRVLALPLVWLIRAYQLVISPLLGPTCRYYPSCSAYALTALQRFGLFRGTWLATRRLCRCHPWSAGGVDHVPGEPTR